MNKIPVIMDCDTGVDDAVAILALLKIPAFDVLGFTCVNGNTCLKNVLRNTAHVLEVAEKDLPIYEGASKPMFCEDIGGADYVHGANGLGGLEFEEPARKPESMKAWDYIYEEAKRQGGALEIIATGPLTNLGMAFMKYKELPSLIKRIVIMGGAASFGNVTPAAEFNIYVDPEAADMVFTSGVPVHMCGLDVTMKAYMTEEEISRFAQKGSAAGNFVKDVTKNSLKWCLSLGLPGMPMHDPCAVVYAAYPELFKTDSVGVRVETKGQLTRGKTVTDLLSDKQFDFKNTEIVFDVDREAFRDKLVSLILDD